MILKLFYIVVNQYATDRTDARALSVAISGAGWGAVVNRREGSHCCQQQWRDGENGEGGRSVTTKRIGVYSSRHAMLEQVQNTRQAQRTEGQIHDTKNVTQQHIQGFWDR